MKLNIRRITNRVEELIYNVKCYFFPHNVIKVSRCPRTWTDRDNLMFHAMFQIFVDFIELEAPLAKWDDRPENKRFTDIQKMREFVNEYYGPEAKVDNMFGPDTSSNPKLSKEAREYNLKRFALYSEWLYLYNWYKNVYPNQVDWHEYYDLQTEKFDISDESNSFVTIKNQDGVLTSRELYEIEEEREIVEDVMLQRILKIRRSLWT